MPPEARGLALIVQSGDFERVHYALSIAAAAAAVGRPTWLFFTLQACRALARGQGWRALTTGDGEPAEACDAGYVERGIAGFESLLESCSGLGVRLLVCEMGLRAVGLEREKLRTDVAIEEGGLATLLLEAGEASLLHI